MVLLKPGPLKREIFTLCDIIEKNASPVNKIQIKKLKYTMSKWDRRDNQETVSRFTKLLD